jgi:FtsZ-interacting cell division protein YlmF|tara:strand:- start:2651 stop:3226 length:576 start_codon:yes stop_codon:yes gene_type:complete
MAKTRINEAKLQSLMDHIGQGGATDKASLASALSGTNRMQNSTIEAYLAAAGERDEDYADIEIDGETLWYDPEAVEEEDVEDQEEDSEEEEDQEEEEPEPEPEPEPKKAKKKDYRFFLRRNNGQDLEMEQVSRKGSVIIFEEKKASQMVKLIVKKKIVEVDLVPLRKAPPEEMNEYGMTNEKLYRLALAAQ